MLEPTQNQKEWEMPVYSVDWWNGEEWCNDQIVCNKGDSMSEMREKFLRFEEQNERHVDNLTISQFKSGKRTEILLNQTSET
tara:strand:- start:149 stop:394 length:246 start_codon:yes stop_codon:yes gene_type:complete